MERKTVLILQLGNIALEHCSIQLSEIIELRLTNEEKTVLFKVYRDGKSLAEIAEEQSADPYETYIHMAASLRKLRHPSSSKLLKNFLKEEQ